MSFKKNYLAIVSSGLLLVMGTMVYLKFTYNSSENNISVSKSSISSSHMDTNAIPSIPPIVQEVLSSSTISNSPSSNDNILNSNFHDVPVPISSSPSPSPSDENKQLQEEKKALLNETKKLQEEAKKRIKEAEKLKSEKEALEKALSLKTSNNDKDTKICISYGPMNIDLKNRFKNILSNNKIASNIYQDRQLPQYEIFWNLGNNKLEALERFEKQKKEGALRDEKFKLTQDNNNNWIVPATTIAGDYAVAENLAKQLSASSSKFGGKWDIREKTGGHYIIFPNVSLISESVLLIIDKDLRLNKTFC
jgi:hypothetical protein